MNTRHLSQFYHTVHTCNSVSCYHLHHNQIMEYKGKDIKTGENIVLKLPKCGDERNNVENYDSLKSYNEEEKLIKLLVTPEYQLEKERKAKGTNQLNIGDKKALEKLLHCHPFPRYQGPFDKPMDEKTYGMCSLTHEEDQYTFGSYTTFKHGDNQPCQMWKINDGQDKDKLNLHFTFNTDQVLPKHNLSGPAADRNMSIMYNCEKHKCVIMCPCAVCNNISAACRKICRGNPCRSCSVQCTDHHIDIPRKYDEVFDSFTIPCSTQLFEPPRITPRAALRKSCTDGKQYAAIPRKCSKCRFDLLDHQIHHQVVHDRCKFCKVDIRVLEKKTSEKMWVKQEQIRQDDEKTCGSCYKVFTRIKTRKLHEKLIHGYYDGSRGRKQQSIVHGVKNDWEKERHQCEHCEKSYASETALKYHQTQVHGLKLVKKSCSICQKLFNSDVTLSKHIRSVHAGECTIKCDYCCSKFKRKDKLARHYREVHHEENVNHHYSRNSSQIKRLIYHYACDICGKKFKRKEHVKQHKDLKHVPLNQKKKTNECEKCELTFTKPGNLVRHVNTVHNWNPDEAHRCQSCGEMFTRKDNTLKHMKDCKLKK